MRRPLTLLFACLVLTLAACGDDGAEPSPAATPEDTGGEQVSGCTPAERPAPKDARFARPKQRLQPGKTYVATMTTSCGTFEITLDAKRAPKTGDSFKFLADEGFYDGLGFHRISPGFVIQGGDPKGDGSGGPGYSIVERPPAKVKYSKGIVAMAKTGLDRAGTSGSQFFVLTADADDLPPDYALLGKITAGQQVVDLIGIAPVGADEQPVEPIVIESVEVAAR